MKQMSVIFVLITISVVLFAQAGSLDPSFGTNGIAIFQPGFAHDIGQDIAYLNDGSLLVCGSTNLTGSTCGMIMKFNSDGTQNTSFGSSDFAVVQIGTTTHVYKLAVLPDGKILVAGQTYMATGNSEMFVARFLADGAPDLTFGTNGYGLTSYSVEEEYNYDMAIQDDGKIILAGRTFLGSWSSMLFTRFTADGVLDTTFGTAGYTVLNDSPQDQAILNLGLLSDGTIVGLGYGYVSTPVYNNYVRMAKLDPDGMPITTFGNNGVLIPPVFTDVCKPFGMQIVNDDIYVTGWILNQANDEVLFITKLDSLGIADPNFGTNGITLTQPTVNDHKNCGYDVMLSPDGYIYVCGVSGYGGLGNPRHSILIRYLMNGQLDPAFNSTGYVVTSIGPDFDECNALVMQADGKIVTTGFEADMSTNNDLYLARYFASGPVSFISVDISEIHFGEVGIGETATEEFEISNIGTAALTYEITFPDWISTTVLSGTIAAGDSVTISVPFSPAAAMEYSGIIEIANNSVNQPLVEIDVDGTGAVYLLDPPLNLSVDTSTGLFTWSAPQSGDPTGYEIVLDEELQGITSDLEWQFTTLRPGYTYEAGVRAVSGEGQSDLATIVFVYEGASAEDDLIGMVGLQGSFPNPFSTQTTISFKLITPAEIELAVYDLKGQKVKTLRRGLLGKGEHNLSWNGEDERGKPLPSGVYFYKMRCGTYQGTGKMILIK
jgi:uncharacterized delta-60 repeat protein